MLFTIYQNKQTYDTCSSVYKYTYRIFMNFLIWADSVLFKNQRPPNESPTQAL